MTKTNPKGQPQGGKSGQTTTDDTIALRWDTTHPFQAELNPTEDSPDGFITYLYMRVWHVKAAGASITIPVTSTAPLGQTGLVPVITGRGRAGDFWTIAVRPEARDEILPREIMREGGVAPHGPREVVAPISLLTWQSNDGTVHRVVDYDDCRPMVRALTEHDCCAYEVGAGADFESIQAAIDALPRSGGHICVREGIYREQIVIAGGRNIVLKGCGARTRIESPADAARDALVTIDLNAGERRVTIRDLAIRAQGQTGIRASGSGSRLELRKLTVAAAASERSALQNVIQVTGIADVRIIGSRLEMDGTLSDHAALYIDCPGRARIEGNTIDTRGDRLTGVSFAWGGLQIAGGSRDIEIRDNRIRGGRGHGITLGSVAFRALDGNTLAIEGPGRGQSDDDSPFRIRGEIRPIVIIGDPDTNGRHEFFPEPLPEIDRCVIAGNVIEAVGASGISSVALQVVHDPRARRAPLCHRRTTFAVSHLLIEDNHIFGCTHHPLEPAPASAFGGVILSDARHATIRNNLIEANGVAQFAICGVCVGRGEDIAIVSNRIRNNGSVSNLSRQFNGAIVIQGPEGAVPIFGEDSPRNVHIRRNVIDEPAVPALSVFSRGACRINNNYFHSERRNADFAGPPIAVLNGGRPWEALDLPLNEPNVDRWVQPAGSFAFLNGTAQQFPAGDGGALSFHGNVMTVLAAGESTGTLALGALLFSSDHTSVVGNRFSAQSLQTSLPNVLVGGVTTDASGNRVAETLNSTPVSVAAMASMLTACSSNILTHCPAVFGCENNGNPDYFISEDNLVWFRPVDGGCERPAGQMLELLRSLCAVFSPRAPGINFSFVARNRVQP